ncbi:hypothetical protein PG987_001629 [Apiospora arundinis]
MASSSNQNYGAQLGDRDLEDWLHLTGWHNEQDRKHKLQQFRDIHHEYETKRRELMRGTFDQLGQPLENQDPGVEMEMERAGNKAEPWAAQTPYHSHPEFGDPHAAAAAEHHYEQSFPPDPYPGRSGRARGRTYRSRSPIRGGRGRGRGGDSGGGDEYRQGGENTTFYEHEPVRARPIKEIDLGGSQDTRFFMIKSVDTHNIYQCQEDNIWATSSVAKGDILADAYENTKNVVLFFSANGSRAIQGYARMHGPPDRNLPRPSWYRQFARHTRMSEPFAVDWLSKNVCPDRQMKGLCNHLNRDDRTGVFLGPNRSRDCQEIDDECGRAMLDILKSHAATGRD